MKTRVYQVEFDTKENHSEYHHKVKVRGDNAKDAKEMASYYWKIKHEIGKVPHMFHLTVKWIKDPTFETALYHFF